MTDATPTDTHSIPTWTSLRAAAQGVLDCLERAKRDDGSEYVRCVDGTWLQQDKQAGPILAAHRQADGGLMMPDDHRYQMVHDALCALSNLDDDADEEAAHDELFNIEPPIYTHDLCAWLASNNYRQGYCDEAMEEGLVTEESTMFDRLQAGYIQEQNEVSIAVLSWIMDHIEEPKEEEG